MELSSRRKNQDAIHTFDEISKCMIIGTHPRSGTHLTIDLLRKQFRDFQSWLWWGETLHNSYLDLDHLMRITKPYVSESKALNLLTRANIPLIKTHSFPSVIKLGAEHSELIRQIRQKAHIYYVVRDGRDVLCSVYLWKNAGCSLSEFIRQEENGLSRPRIWANHILSWLNEQNIRVLKFEHIIKNPHHVLNQIADEQGLEPLWAKPLLPQKKRLTGSRGEDYWLRLTRQLENTTIVGRKQGQKPPKWQQAFTREDCEFFHQEAGEVLIRLGYEVSGAWAEAES